MGGADRWSLLRQAQIACLLASACITPSQPFVLPASSATARSVSQPLCPTRPGLATARLTTRTARIGLSLESRNLGGMSEGYVHRVSEKWGKEVAREMEAGEKATNDAGEVVGNDHVRAYILNLEQQLDDLRSKADVAAADSDATPSSKGFTPSVSLEDLRRSLADFAAERNWDQHHTPRNIVLALTGEVGELAEIFQWRTDAGCARGLPEFSADDKVHVGEEMSDVMLYLIRLADVCGVDLPAAAKDKLRKNAKKYPADKVKGSSAKYTAYIAEGDDAEAGSRAAKKARHQ